MKQDISFNMFCDSFSESRENTFSYQGKEALFNYLNELEEETGQNIELDIIALCCEYTEYESVEDYLNQYHPSEVLTFEDFKEQNDLNKGYQEMDTYLEEAQEELKSYLEDHTQIIYLGDDLNDGFIIQDF